ncbi:MAG TPA: ATP-binding cassette domain-containing protein [Candidatus Ornithomonoglobus intestinigallinarum]|uniref:ATP-binding cassette domain-containing protein n=1 Tax=Candidatus Ornithomonoglobus intestinigallinarum TaxID=2840894 RepID=A0A9D1KPE8_9FIRM|nr:ATP-binding cassette domain-containing protein [Candidatus Ornithomonoglobus intestinigallinarum]
MLKLENICWTAPDGREILKGVDLEIPDGQLTVITGPNGSGKTTLARIIAGIETPSSGRILLDGRDITNDNVTERAREGVSFAFQQPVRFKGITVRNLLETAIGEKAKEGRLCSILGDVGLCSKDYLDREVNSTLSGGEMKRVEIATVLARNSRLTVFDEPEAGIDLWSFKSLIGVFRRIHESMKGSMIIISHQERILKIADEIVLLADGKIASRGTGTDMMPQVLSSGSVKAACCREEALFNE